MHHLCADIHNPDRMIPTTARTTFINVLSKTGPIGEIKKGEEPALDESFELQGGNLEGRKLDMQACRAVGDDFYFSRPMKLKSNNLQPGLFASTA